MTCFIKTAYSIFSHFTLALGIASTKLIFYLHLPGFPTHRSHTHTHTQHKKKNDKSERGYGLGSCNPAMSRYISNPLRDWFFVLLLVGGARLKKWVGGYSRWVDFALGALFGAERNVAQGFSICKSRVLSHNGMCNFLMPPFKIGQPRTIGLSWKSYKLHVCACSVVGIRYKRKR